MKPWAFFPQNFSEKAPTQQEQHNQPFCLYGTTQTLVLHLLEHWPRERLVCLNMWYTGRGRWGKRSTRQRRTAVPVLPSAGGSCSSPPPIPCSRHGCQRLFTSAAGDQRAGERPRCCRRLAAAARSEGTKRRRVQHRHLRYSTQCRASKELLQWQSKPSLNIRTGGMTPVTSGTLEPWIYSRISSSGAGRWEEVILILCCERCTFMRNFWEYINSCI